MSRVNSNNKSIKTIKKAEPDNITMKKCPERVDQYFKTRNFSSPVQPMPVLQ